MIQRGTLSNPSPNQIEAGEGNDHGSAALLGSRNDLIPPGQGSLFGQSYTIDGLEDLSLQTDSGESPVDSLLGFGGSVLAGQAGNTSGLEPIELDRGNGFSPGFPDGNLPTFDTHIDAPFVTEQLLFETPEGNGQSFGNGQNLGTIDDSHNMEDHEGSEDHEDSDFHLDGLPGVDLALVQGITGITGSDLPTQGGTVDLAKTFALNSNLGASHTIYLDFNGHTTTDSAWTQFNGGNTIVTSAYDFDGNTSSFSTSELTRIQYIWQRVAEDFSPFNVNVTTADPGIEALRRSGSGDTQWGTRVVIGAGSWYGNVGGVAYVSSFTSSSDLPAFVFENNLGNGNEKYTAEAISHEAGHALGLSHDGQGTTEYYQGQGSGATGWAPILGNGYYRELTQFSRGEYTGAANTQDDLAIITGNNGFSYRADDHGNTFASATSLGFGSTSVSASGIIERNTDFDVFSFYTGAGTVSLNLNTAPRGANLDILANLYNASGSLVASSNPLNALNASFNLGLAAGQYFLQVSGTGQGDPANGGYSNYGSLGQYTLSGSIVDPGGDFLNISPLNADQSEGNSGSRVFSFVVNRSGNTSGATSVQYQVSGVGANAVSASDFSNGILPTGTVQFAANETSKVIEIAVNGDTVVEADEGFRVSLVNPGATTTLITTSADGVIRNDDTPPPPPVLPTVSISSATLVQNEGNSGTTAYRFTVSLDRASSDAVTVNFQTNDGSATVANGDYIDNDGSLVFNPGGALSQTITVLANGDTVVEADESFTVQLTGATNAQIANGLATGTLVNDDVAVAPANFVISDVVTAEGTGRATLTVSRSGNTSSTASVGYTTVNGSGKNGAKSGSDFIAAQNTLTFAAGEVSKTFEVGVINDASQERNESFYVDLRNASSNATILDARGIVTILDDDSSATSSGGKGGKSAAPSAISAVDSILGVGASDTIVGAQTSIATHRGTRGQDVFILGDEQGALYAEAGDQDFALIAGLNARQDTIQLHGSGEDYQLIRGSGDQPGFGLFYGEGSEQDLIAVIRGNSTLSLESATFRFV